MTAKLGPENTYFEQQRTGSNAQFMTASKSYRTPHLVLKITQQNTSVMKAKLGLETHILVAKQIQNTYLQLIILFSYENKDLFWCHTILIPIQSLKKTKKNHQFHSKINNLLSNNTKTYKQTQLIPEST